MCESSSSLNINNTRPPSCTTNTLSLQTRSIGTIESLTDISGSGAGEMDTNLKYSHTRTHNVHSQNVHSHNINTQKHAHTHTPTSGTKDCTPLDTHDTSHVNQTHPHTHTHTHTPYKSDDSYNDITLKSRVVDLERQLSIQEDKYIFKLNELKEKFNNWKYKQNNNNNIPTNINNKNNKNIHNNIYNTHTQNDSGTHTHTHTHTHIEHHVRNN
eukprot:GHVR01095623.1.p1 GENE.GHVR01095623.1~~GHVR01095623.1.p1  ORF type:complete len:247 (+),score=192.42 GHVR01095623.1:105-743(+)